jgi:hypothetical protein
MDLFLGDITACASLQLHLLSNFGWEADDEGKMCFWVVLMPAVLSVVMGSVVAAVQRSAWKERVSQEEDKMKAALGHLSSGHLVGGGLLSEICILSWKTRDR